MPKSYLDWPESWPRTPEHQRGDGRFNKSRTIGAARNSVLAELKRFGATNVRLSVDMPTRGDGEFYASAATPRDPGVALFFHYRGRPQVMACDTYTRLQSNLRAIELTIEALRSIERHATSGLLARAMSGFTALPAGSDAANVRPWWEVLAVPQIGDATPSEIASDPEHPLRTPVLRMAEALYKQKVPGAHPDRGGDPAAMRELARAIAEAREALGNTNEETES